MVCNYTEVFHWKDYIPLNNFPVMCDTHLDKIYNLEDCLDNLTYCLQTLAAFGTLILAVYNFVSRFSCQIVDLFDSWLSETCIRNCFEELYLEV